MAFGNDSSTTPISFANLFKILPDEFELKNPIVALIILLNIVLCNLIDARMQMKKKENDRNNVIKIVTIVIPEYMYMQ